MTPANRIIETNLLCGLLFLIMNLLSIPGISQTSRERISINDDWRFIKGDPVDVKGLIYDVRPEVTDRNDNVVADTKPTEAITTAASENVLKKWILPTANDFIKDPAKHHRRPEGNPGENVSYVQNNFN